MAIQDQAWYPVVSLSLKIGLALSLGYVAYDYFTRPGDDIVEEQQAEPEPLHEDLYVTPPKSHVSSYETADRLVGMDLWTQVGWYHEVEPGGRLLGPLEKVTPTRVFERNGDLLLEFEKDGKPSTLVVGRGGRVLVDNMFFAGDPKEAYDHWSEESWRKIEAGEVTEGMSEHQVTFALGVGVPRQVSGSRRVVDFIARRQAGLEPLRVTFIDNRATKIEPVPPEELG